MVNHTKLNQKPVEYYLEIETGDFNIKDINFVKFNNKLYLAPNYYLELKGIYQKFDGILITGTINEKRILDTGIEGDPFHRGETHLTEYIGEGIMFNDVKISDDTVLKVHITYTVDKVKKDFYEDIKLSERIKPYSK
ncbi:hypothetical protein D3C78_1315480 [compost metagenome]